jgi:hypothetical protein
VKSYGSFYFLFISLQVGAVLQFGSLAVFFGMPAALKRFYACGA